MVVTDTDQLLVIQERFYTAHHWKLPGGYVDPGENIAEAAIRAGTETVRSDEYNVQRYMSCLVVKRGIYFHYL